MLFTYDLNTPLVSNSILFVSPVDFGVYVIPAMPPELYTQFHSPVNPEDTLVDAMFSLEQDPSIMTNEKRISTHDFIIIQWSLVQFIAAKSIPIRVAGDKNY
jgi:hypothetical protein